MSEIKIGDSVVFNLDGVKVHGTVESEQVKKNLVDVKIYQPGHRSHCLIVARPPDTLTLADEDDDEENAHSIFDISKDDLDKFAEYVKGKLDSFSPRLESFEGKLHELTESLAALTARLDGIEGKKKELEAEAPAQEDNAKSA
jgi:hypothetical protein